MPERILLVDDDERMRERLANALRARGFEVMTADSAEAALLLFEQHTVARAVFDIRMGGASGMSLLEMVRKRWPRVIIVMLSGYGSISAAVDAVKLGAVNFLCKPADADMILAAFESSSSVSTSIENDYSPPTLARAEWDLINRVLDDCGGNVSRAARMLGLHRRTLQRKLKMRPDMDRR